MFVRKFVSPTFPLQEHVFKYHTCKLGDLSPHVFALTEAAFTSIVDDHINQVS